MAAAGCTTAPHSAVHCLSAGPDHWLHEKTLNCVLDDSAVPVTRKRTCTFLHEWGLTEVITPAAYVVSELLTNALQATRQRRPYSPVGVRLLANPGHLVIEVWDCVHAPPSRRAERITERIGRVPGDCSEARGSGLVIVDALCSEWGYFHRPDGGKVVYAIFRYSE